MFLILIVLMLILGLSIFIARSTILIFFPILGAFLGIFLFLGLGSDGSLTQVSGASTVPLVSATLSTFTWEAITLVPILFMLFDFMLAIGRAVRKL